ncbi:MAG: DMT family transporter [Ahniella sp.]|nr:DMT family transporter [Ahniella sp.]
MAESFLAVGRGELFSLAAAATWGIGVIIYRKLGARLPPLQLNLLKNLIVLGLIAPVAFLIDRHGLQALTTNDLLIVCASGVLGIGLADTLYFRALNELGAARTGIIGNLYSPFVIGLSFLFLDERLGGRQMIGFALVAAGVLVISTGNSTAASSRAHMRAVLQGVLSIALMAISVVMVKRVLEAHSVWWISGLRVAAGAAGLALLLAVSGQLRGALGQGVSRRDWALLSLGAIVGQFFSMILWLAGYKYTTASVAAILNETASAFIVLFAWIFLREHISGRKLAGLLLTLSGVCLMLMG